MTDLMIEPQDVGAVVQDGNGDEWVRVHRAGDSAPWRRVEWDTDKEPWSVWSAIPSPTRWAFGGRR